MPAAELPGIGIDIVEVERVERALERRPRLAERLFRPAELAYARSRARPAMHLAARFAAKEAAVKALGPASPVALRDLEVVSRPGEAPRLVLHGEAARHAAQAGVELRVSLTHTRDTAAAMAATTPAHTFGHVNG